MEKEINKSKKELIFWFAEYAYYMANPNSKMDVPSIVYEQVDKDFTKFLNKDKFKKELSHLINCHSKENSSDTPDFLLAEYLNDCLNAFDKIIQLREVKKLRKMS